MSQSKVKIFIKKLKNRIIFSQMKKTYLHNGVVDKIVFCCDNGENYGGDPKAISETVRVKCRRYEIVWLFNNPMEKKNIVPSYVKCVKNGTLSAYKEMATAKVLVSNKFFDAHVYKGRKQVYIQTWYGDKAIKKIFNDLEEDKRILDSDICDLMVCGSEFGKRIYKSAFGYNGEIYNFGCPRNDILVNGTVEEISDIKKKLNLENSRNVKYLLYAPVYNPNRSEKELLDIGKVILELENRDNVKWIPIVRFDYREEIEGSLDILKSYSKEIVNMSKVDDISEVLLVSDCLITDYNTCLGDFALRKKAIVLYHPNDGNYSELQYYFDIKEAPFLVGKNVEEVCEIIKYLDDEKAWKNSLAITKFYETIETGFSTRKVVEYINKIDYEDGELLY